MTSQTFAQGSALMIAISVSGYMFHLLHPSQAIVTMFTSSATARGYRKHEEFVPASPVGKAGRSRG